MLKANRTVFTVFLPKITTHLNLAIPISLSMHISSYSKIDALRNREDDAHFCADIFGIPNLAHI
jgi:hypothetical protein